MRQLRTGLIFLLIFCIGLWTIQYAYVFFVKNKTTPALTILAPADTQVFRISTINKIQKIPVNKPYNENKRTKGLIFAVPYYQTPNIQLLLDTTKLPALPLEKLFWDKILTTPANDLLDNSRHNYSIYKYTFTAADSSTFPWQDTIPLTAVILFSCTLLGWYLRKYISIPVAIGALIISLCIPILISGYYDDDIYMDTSMKGKLALQETTYTAMVIDEITYFLNNGRFTPIGHAASRTIFCFVENSYAYKLIIIMMTLLTFWLFYIFLKLYTKHAYLALSLIPLILQMRQYHDPLTSYFTLMQLLACFSLGAWILLVQGLRKDKNLLILGAGLLQVCAALTFETAYFMLPIPLILFWLEKNRQKLTLAAGYFLPIVLLLGFVGYMYQHAGTEQYIGLKANIDSLLIIKTWLLQISSTLPGIVLLSDPAVLSSTLLLQPVWLLLLLVVCTTTAAIMQRLEPLPQQSLRSSWPILLLGVALIALPALSIATSIKYQSSLYLGIGYLPVYIQALGMLCLLYVLYQSMPKVHRSTILLLCVFISGLVFINNIYTVNIRNLTIDAPRALLRQAARQGFFTNIPDNSTLIFTQAALGNTHNYRYFLYYYTHKKFTCVYGPELKAETARTYYLENSGQQLLLKDHQKKPVAVFPAR